MLRIADDLPDDRLASLFDLEKNVRQTLPGG